MSAIESWKMTGGDAAPLFAEYLEMAHAAGWADIIKTDKLQLCSSDALIVVDMQNDFIPIDGLNPTGGAFAVAEGGNIVNLIVRLMELFAAHGATVIPTRDYHPDDHCSFIPNGGHFPPHCIQGSEGSKFYKSIGDCFGNLRALGKSAEVVFKGFHEHVDSFGSFEYPNEPASWTRVANKDVPERLHGCTLAAWTGAIHLKCSNIDADYDAPPDILSVYRRTTLAELLRQKGIKRVFACGLALDFCVLDTCLNGVKAGFEEVFMVLDAARAAHLPGIGSVGSGFLQDPAELKAKMMAAGVKLCPAASLIPNFPVQSPLAFENLGRTFPENLGPFALIPTKRLQLTIDNVSNKYRATAPADVLQSLTRFGVEPMGSIAPRVSISLDATAREQLSIPPLATSFFWAYPASKGNFTEQALGYFAITAPSAAFLTFGGFVYMDAADQVVGSMAVAIGGSGLVFSTPQRWNAQYSAALSGRWQPVTAPHLRRKGAQLFAWINPGEVLSVGDVPPWKVCDHGAFAYLFHEDLAAEDSRDVFFGVASSSPPKSCATLGRISHAENGSAAAAAPGTAPHPGPGSPCKARSRSPKRGACNN